MKRNKFNLSRYILTGFNFGQLIPVNWTEVLPGDTFQGNTTALVRLMPLVAPVMHPVHLTIHHWFVPWRLCWEQWEDFIVKVNDNAIIAPVATIQVAGATMDTFNRIEDYFGIQRQVESPTVAQVANTLMRRAYNVIWNEWYRDQDLEGEVNRDTSGAVLYVSWKKDRYTTARTTAQKGTAVTVPVGGPISVETLRNAFAAQKFREARNRYGSRYVEYLRYLGVTPSDARLQRPEFLGGGTQTIQFSEVLQTSETGTTPQGNMAGHGIAAVRSNTFRRFFSEHGCVLSLAFVRPVNIYGSGADRFFFKSTADDFWNKELQHIGQQVIPNRELFIQGNASDASTFGYQDRYDEYRYAQSRATTTFTANANKTGGAYIGPHYPWSFSRSFIAHPTLSGGQFSSCQPRTDPFAASGEADQHLVIMAHNHLVARRLVSKHGDPRLAL